MARTNVMSKRAPVPLCKLHSHRVEHLVPRKLKAQQQKPQQAAGPCPAGPGGDGRSCSPWAKVKMLPAG